MEKSPDIKSISALYSIKMLRKLIQILKKINYLEQAMLINNHKYVFIAGLHRSGTTLLADCLKQHPDISSFANTGFPKDEGQFLQSVYPPAREYGGPGKFGFCQEMHLTEGSNLINNGNRDKLYKEWSRYWDTTKPILMEKSPPNILKTRFLQEIFNDSYFLVITRHPLAVSLATQKWSFSTLEELLLHWAICHKIFLEDLPYLKKCLIIKYEDLTSNLDSTLVNVYGYIGTFYHPYEGIVNKNINESYFHNWKNDDRISKIRSIVIKHERIFSCYGYYFNEVIT